MQIILKIWEISSKFSRRSSKWINMNLNEFLPWSENSWLEDWPSSTTNNAWSAIFLYNFHHQSSLRLKNFWFVRFRQFCKKLKHYILIYIILTFEKTLFSQDKNAFPAIQMGFLEWDEVGLRFSSQFSTSIWPWKLENLRISIIFCSN